MGTKSMGYDHAAYLARQSHSFPALAAGASGVTSKFVAFTNLQVYSITAANVTTGSTTSTGTLWNGTATVTFYSADQVSLIRITNTAPPGSAVAMATQTFGPFAVSPYNGTATATQTAVAGNVNNIQVAYAGTATTGQLQVGSAAYTGGISVQQGDQLYILRGTDASAVTAVAIEYSVTPLANVSN